MVLKPGFSLIELLVTVLILAILIGIGTPSIEHFFTKESLKREVDRIFLRFQAERFKAILQKRSRQVLLSDQGLFFREKGGAWEADTQEPTFSYYRSLSTGPCIRNGIPDSALFTFNPTGTATSLTVCIKEQQLYQKIIVSSYGRIRKSEVFQ